MNDKITCDITSVKNRIKSFLMFFGIVISQEFQGKKWTKSFTSWLQQLRPGGLGDVSFMVIVQEYVLLTQLETLCWINK